MNYINKMKMLLLCSLATVAMAYTEEEEKEWELFKTEYEKVYKDEKEENLRKDIFFKNLKFIHEHNIKYSSGEVTYSVGINKFADLSIEEFWRDIMCNISRKNENVGRSLNNYEPYELYKIPKSIDWARSEWKVKDQGGCRACWAFSVTGAIEGQLYKKKKKQISLSEQQLIDCVPPKLEDHCNEEFDFDEAFEYIFNHKGIYKEKDYPYKNKKRPCKDHKKKTHVAAKIDGFGSWEIPMDGLAEKERLLQILLANKGPTPVYFKLPYHQHIQFYKSGVYICPKKYEKHMVAMLAVGYDTNEKKQDYFRFRNSMGTTWGEDGYIKIARNHKNPCNIISTFVFPIM